ncbi:MAG: hypothetical protein ABI871_02615 [Chthoniobacterales bacterium]
MKLLKVKNVRFAAVLEKCGAPMVYTLWQKPAVDRNFQTLLRNERIMTILPTETGTDFGQVGFCERDRARFLAFPKSLKRFCDQRIVGIKWDQVQS